MGGTRDLGDIETGQKTHAWDAAHPVLQDALINRLTFLTGVSFALA
jgi:hypothetical protein